MSQANTPDPIDPASADDTTNQTPKGTQYKTTFTAIRKARRFALQGLYEWQMTHNPAHDIEARTRAINAMHTVHLGYYHELLHHIIKQTDELDELIEPYLERESNRLDPVERQVLRIGVYELQHRLEIPYKVVLDEANQLNSHFGSPEGIRFINGVLHQLAQQLRSIEVQADMDDTDAINVGISTDNANEPIDSVAQTSSEDNKATHQPPTASNKTNKPTVIRQKNLREAKANSNKQTLLKTDKNNPNRIGIGKKTPAKPSSAKVSASPDLDVKVDTTEQNSKSVDNQTSDSIANKSQGADSTSSTPAETHSVDLKDTDS